ncbi:MAG: ECF transporter S component [Candidatus Heimdallarchaeota archaeon]|nr:ECF transporter S component [Candidatus Heimdallarchaeota archaeon]MBY8994004.1 ECF transporter S component [Candidatus Heimdallarchaeota archaeon]
MCSLQIDKTEKQTDTIEGKLEQSDSEDLPEMKEFKGKTLLVELAGGAILGGMSIVFAFLVNPYMPTVPLMGIKIIDFIAIPMILAYIVFGIRGGLLATLIGSVFILLLPEYLPWVGMLAKFSATIPMIIVPWLFFKTNKFTSKSRIINLIDETSENLLKYYPFLMAVAVLIRLLLMFTLNLFAFVPLYSGISITVDPKMALILAAGYALWNIVQGTIDAYLPYLIAYPTRLAKTFSTW